MFDNANQLLLFSQNMGVGPIDIWQGALLLAHQRKVPKPREGPGPGFSSRPLDPVLYQLSNSIPERRAHRCPELRTNRNESKLPKSKVLPSWA